MLWREADPCERLLGRCLARLCLVRIRLRTHLLVTIKARSNASESCARMTKECDIRPQRVCVCVPFVTGTKLPNGEFLQSTPSTGFSRPNGICDECGKLREKPKTMRDPYAFNWRKSCSISFWTCAAVTGPLAVVAGDARRFLIFQGSWLTITGLGWLIARQRERQQCRS